MNNISSQIYDKDKVIKSFLLILFLIDNGILTVPGKNSSIILRIAILPGCQKLKKTYGVFWKKLLFRLKAT